MAGNDFKLKNVKLKLNEVSIKRLLARKVVRNNSTSGKLTVPKELIGKEVYVLLEE